uniref:Udp-glucuronic acid decarboxylase 1-like n=1 Tax=Tetraselmis sp. GSL018 TaxID=582737 RepID=A0A061QQN8_9CHLO|eukprot:CAMPEP_0177594100 /NCGR_PEP_ID=MMETSP0419_2-20121207/9583_1 /TAXON_ID=582737 /ORGANISM="Tetraselmis sp., Strain GSL018" /LENGTH=140 /DNA_ID=CAMNT_0019085351 /DNA_START=852 /DNA_END=1274 /DNA_ORIENTATION=+
MWHAMEPAHSGPQWTVTVETHEMAWDECVPVLPGRTHRLSHVCWCRSLSDNEVVGPINLGNPGEFTMLELAKLVQEIVNPKADIVFMENTSDDPNRRQPDITKAKTLLGWEPVVPLREGLAMMVDDFRTRLTRLGDKVVA